MFVPYIRLYFVKFNFVLFFNKEFNQLLQYKVKDVDVSNETLKNQKTKFKITNKISQIIAFLQFNALRSFRYIEVMNLHVI